MSDTREICDALDLEYWLERESVSFRLSPGRSGMQLNVHVCPACGDRRYRVYLNQETGQGNCFVCSETFHKTKFIHLTLRHGDKEWSKTFQHIRECLAEQGWRPRRMVSVAVNVEKATFPTSFKLPTGEGQNLVYLEERGIKGDLAQYFHLRYCETGYWNYTNETGKRCGQFFGGRVIIPVYDLDGEFVTFQGRDVSGKEVEKKYLFPKGLPGTGRYLLNAQNAARLKRVCMGEGAFDVMACKIAFDEEPALRDVVPIGSFGKHLSYGDMEGNDQLGRFIQLKGMGLEEVTIMWDGEHKALIAALEAAEKLVGIGLRTKIAVLPADRDPNEVAPKVVREAFWGAQPYSKSLAIQWRLRSPIRALSA